MIPPSERVERRVAGTGGHVRDGIRLVRSRPMITSIIVSLVSGLITVGVLWTLARADALPFDRRARLRSGQTDLPLTVGSCAASVPVALHLTLAEVPAVVQESLLRVGAHEVGVVDPWTVVGWLGCSWRSLGQQVGVAAAATGPGEVTLWCCSRPRFATTLVDFGASQRAALRLAAELSRFDSPEHSPRTAVAT